MFGFLKKKIKESIGNLTKAVSRKAGEKPEKPAEEAIDSRAQQAEPAVIFEEVIAKETEEAIEKTENEIVPDVVIKIPTGEAVEEKPIAEKPAEEKPKEGFFGKMAKKFARRVTEVSVKEEDVEGVLDELKTGLMENDVAFDVAEKICGDVGKNIAGKSINRSKVEETVKAALRASVMGVISQEKISLGDFIRTKIKPVLLLFVGFNGAGKTTALARVGNYLKRRGFRCIFAAGDSFRAASIEQLQVHGDRLGIKVIRHNYGADSAAVIFDAMKYASAHNIDVVLADTAGRTHVNVNLIDELKKVCRVNKPAMKILVLDSLTGNDIVQQAQKFDEAVGVDTIVFTKTDVHEKGGAILSASYTTKRPILFLGTGQGYDDLEEFDAYKIIDDII